MTTEVLIALVGVGGIAVGALGQFVTAMLSTRTARKAGDDTAQDRLIDQLQQELERYRERTDKRLDELEVQVRGYRAFIGVQRDHMAEHGVPLPPWPDHLPR